MDTQNAKWGVLYFAQNQPAPKREIVKSSTFLERVKVQIIFDKPCNEWTPRSRWETVMI